MFNWKHIATAIIVLFVLAWFVGSSPSVTNFFSAVREKGSALAGLLPASPVASSGGDIAFAAELDALPANTFELRDSSTHLQGRIGLRTETGVLMLDDVTLTELNATAALEPLDIDGSAAVASPVAQLDRTHVRINGTVVTATMTAASAPAIALDTSGMLAFDTTQTRFDGAVEITNFRGSVTVANSTTLLNGTASRIRIPSAGIDRRA